MPEEDRKTWLHAAYLALEGFPADLIARGARAALAVADHPSKIVPAIIKAVGETWENRRGLEARRARTAAENAAQIEANRRLTHQPADGEVETTSEILARTWPTMHEHAPGYRAGKLNLDPNRECRSPTRADYLALGVEPESLDAIGIKDAE